MDFIGSINRHESADAPNMARLVFFSARRTSPRRERLYSSRFRAPSLLLISNRPCALRIAPINNSCARITDGPAREVIIIQLN